jgi:hypothetical protein
LESISPPPPPSVIPGPAMAGQTHLMNLADVSVSLPQATVISAQSDYGSAAQSFSVFINCGTMSKHLCIAHKVVVFTAQPNFQTAHVQPNHLLSPVTSSTYSYRGSTRC